MKTGLYNAFLINSKSCTLLMKWFSFCVVYVHCFGPSFYTCMLYFRSRFLMAKKQHYSFVYIFN